MGNKNKDKIVVAGSGLSIRNNCSTGCWTIGGETRIEGDIEICLLYMESFTGALRGKEDVYDWIQLWFVGAPNETKLPKNIVCHTLIKTQSKDNFLSVFTSNYNNDPEELIWCPKFLVKNGVDPNTNQKTTYYSLGWNVRKRTKEEEGQLKLIHNFINEGVALIDDNCPITKIPNYLPSSESKALLSASEIPNELESIRNIPY